MADENRRHVKIIDRNVEETRNTSCIETDSCSARAAQEASTGFADDETFGADFSKTSNGSSSSGRASSGCSSLDSSSRYSSRR